MNFNQVVATIAQEEGVTTADTRRVCMAFLEKVRQVAENGDKFTTQFLSITPLQEASGNQNTELGKPTEAKITFRARQQP